MNLREDCSVKDSWLISQIRLDDGFRNLLGFEVLLGDVCKVMLLKVTLTEHSVVGLLINRGEPHHVFTVRYLETSHRIILYQFLKSSLTILNY